MSSLSLGARRSNAGAWFTRYHRLRQYLGWGAMGLCVLSSFARAQSPTATFEHEQTVDAPSILYGSHPPIWSGNASLWFHDNLTDAPLINSFNRDGVDERLSFEMTGAAVVNIRGVSGGNDGSIVAAGSVTRGDMRRAGFVAVILPDRKRRTVISTEPFMPEEAVLAADGTIWAIGLVVKEPEGANIEYNVMRRYTAAGKLLSSRTLSEVRGHLSYPRDAVELSRLVASGDRVGWFTGGCEYIEFRLDGAELARYEPPVETHTRATMRIDELRGIGLSQEDRLVIGWRKSDVPTILELNRRTGRWNITHLSPEPTTGVLGFDGNVLVAANHSALERFRISVPPAVN